MSALLPILLRRIEQSGPMPLSEYMALCLGHPEHGYYTSRDPLGAAGDFTTAPEISQMFGELLGLWLAQAWMDQGAPRGVYAELGPGRGTLSADALRAASRVPGLAEALGRPQLVDISPVLRARQAEALAGRDPEWRDRVEDLPDGPLFLLANEFFDALPIRQYQKRGGRWRERVVTAKDGKLALALGPLAKADDLPAHAPEGALREHSPACEAVAAQIGARLAAHGGAALIVDYGYPAQPLSGGDTFQAMRGHAYTDPYEAPGEADLTAHVDFAAIAKAAEAAGAKAWPLMTQGALLETLGITARAQALAARGDAEAVAAAHRRLCHPEEMGTLFKALALTGPDAPPPPGFG
ncbi:class I SAM-dependent methyltransferase [Rhodovulum sp. DZ06]|uniref:class I SAM-dependent methyltransferase n=1 Tax=Rhodovulum sp. DZ06 TaxID=3425126 RepID=UPI003D33932E